jgi:folate-dependent phosphoribosylglycinamide formyltransferase PurN
MTDITTSGAQRHVNGKLRPSCGIACTTGLTGPIVHLVTDSEQAARVGEVIRRPAALCARDVTDQMEPRIHAQPTGISARGIQQVGIQQIDVNASDAERLSHPTNEQRRFTDEGEVL